MDISSWDKRRTRRDVLKEVRCRFCVVGLVPLELGCAHVPEDLIGGNLGVVDADLASITNQALADINGRRLAGVASVLLEGKAKDGNLLLRDGVEHGANDALDEPEGSRL